MHFAVFCALAAVSLSMAINDDIHLSDVAIEGLADAAVAKIEARTKEEVAAIESQEDSSVEMANQVPLEARKLLADRVLWPEGGTYGAS